MLKVVFCVGLVAIRSADKHMTKIYKPEEAFSNLKADVVFASGSFDLLHPGHTYFLKTVKKKLPESVFILAVLSDENIRLRKGEDRPILSLEQRVDEIVNNTYVDRVIPWTKPWEDLREYVLKNKPRFLAVGEEDDALENKKFTVISYGGELIVIPRIKEYSTTKLINEKL